MPTPVGHSLAGSAIFIFSRTGDKSKSIKELLLYVLVSIMPDFDFIPGIFIGNPNYFHHGVTHSIGFAFLVALIASRIIKFNGYPAWKNFSIFFSLYMAHTIIDYFAVDTTGPFGEKLLWPFSNSYYLSSHPVFMGVKHSDLAGLFSLYNIKVILYEILLFLPLNLLFLLLKRIKSDSREKLKAKEADL